MTLIRAVLSTRAPWNHHHVSRHQHDKYDRPTFRHSISYHGLHGFLRTPRGSTQRACAGSKQAATYDWQNTTSMSMDSIWSTQSGISRAGVAMTGWDIINAFGTLKAVMKKGIARLGERA